MTWTPPQSPPNLSGERTLYVDLETKDRVRLADDKTDSQGQFAVAVPRGPFEVRYDPAQVIGGTFAPHADELDLVQDTNVGDVKLLPGFTVASGGWLARI